MKRVGWVNFEALSPVWEGTLRALRRVVDGQIAGIDTGPHGL